VSSWRRSAAYRIAFIYSAAFALAVLALGAAVYFAADAAFRHQQDAALSDETAELVGDFRNEGMGELVETIDARERGAAIAAFGYAVFDADGRRVAGRLDIARPPDGYREVMVRRGGERDPARALTTALDSRTTLTVAVDSEGLERIDATILMLFGGGFVAIVAIGIAGSFALGAYLRRRLASFTVTAHQIVGGELDQRMPVGVRNDEFDALARSLNAMLDRIALLIERLRQVSGDLAHDMRTPLSRLRAGLERALDGPPDLTVQRQALKQAIRQSDAMLALFAGILRIAEVERGDIARGFVAVDLADVVADLCDSYAPAIRDGGRTLTCTAIPGPAEVMGNRELLAQAIVNLLDNTQTHTPRGTAITLALTLDAARVMVRVADDGPGVAAADRARIVERFVRLEASRHTPGHGLGLNLVDAIVAAHRGTLDIEDNAPGLAITMTFTAVTA